MKNEKQIAKYLLQSKAIKLQPSNPYTWASGWRSPIYCDNRKTLSFPEIRNYIRDSFVSVIKEHYPEAELIAGVATGGIAQGVLVAQELNLPFVYVRSSPKGHGLQNLVEGVLEKNQKTVVIEDLVSTGGSSIKAVYALRDAGADILGMSAIFTYGFALAEDNFQKAGCKLITLGDYTALSQVAAEEGVITDEEIPVLTQWRENPEYWGK